MNGRLDGKQLLQAISRLPRAERQVLELRFGLDGSVRLTLEEVGDRLHMTRAVVRMSEMRALQRLNLVTTRGDEFMRAMNQARALGAQQKWLRSVAARAIRPSKAAKTQRAPRRHRAASACRSGGSPPGLGGDDRPRSSDDARLGGALARAVR